MAWDVEIIPGKFGGKSCKTIKMAVMKCDTANNELFIKPVRGLYAKYVISVEDFKDRNAGIMKNCWVDTRHGNQGEKIYELFDSEMDGEIMKESLQEWLFDIRKRNYAVYWHSTLEPWNELCWVV